VEVTVKKLHKPAIVYKVALSGNLKLAGCKIVGVANVTKCWRQTRFRRDLYFLTSTFHLVCNETERLTTDTNPAFLQMLRYVTLRSVNVYNFLW